LPAGGPLPTESLIRPAMTTSPMSRAWTSAARSSAPLGRSRTQALSSSGGVGGKSQTKSQRPSARGIIQPHSAAVIAARCLVQLQRATSSDRKDTPYKRGVTGSNAVAPTRSEGCEAAQPLDGEPKSVRWLPWRTLRSVSRLPEVGPVSLDVVRSGAERPD
jgi:hypothetical protein